MRKVNRVASAVIFSIMTVNSPQPAEAYGLSTHLLLVDIVWASEIRPLLVESFPGQPKEVYDEARAYVYGGALVQDSGYYLRGKQGFSDLTHYARSGDFVSNLFRNATDVDELAFAIGALTHYIGDIEGHSLATNLCVPIAFPDLGKKFGQVVTYEQGENEHRRVEFGFDVNAAKLKRLRPRVLMKDEKPNLSLQQLAFAYYQTYGLDTDLTYETDLSAVSYYLSSGQLLPVATAAKAMADMHRPVRESGSALQLLIDPVSTSEHWADHADDIDIASAGAVPLVILVPEARIEHPNRESQQRYADSVVVAIRKLREVLSSITPTPGHFVPRWSSEQKGSFSGSLPNINLDTGKPEAPDSYRLSDAMHETWLRDLVAAANSRNDQDSMWPVPESSQEHLLWFFSHTHSNVTKQQLESLKNARLGDGCPEKGFGWNMKDPELYKGDPNHSIAGLCPYPSDK